MPEGGKAEAAVVASWAGCERVFLGTWREFCCRQADFRVYGVADVVRV